jgi:hypothetical protein
VAVSKKKQDDNVVAFPRNQSSQEPIPLTDEDHERAILEYVRQNFGWHGSTQDHEEISDEALLAAIRGTMDYMGLDVTTGEDGTWLHFQTAPGNEFSVNVCEYAKDFPHLEKWITQWCEERRRAHAET